MTTFKPLGLLIVLLTCSCTSLFTTSEIINPTQQKSEYDDLVRDCKYNLVYDHNSSSSFQINHKITSMGSLSDIYNYATNQKINGELLVITFSKGTHFRLSHSAVKEFAQMIANDFSNRFTRVIVRNATSCISQAGVVFDTKKRNR